MPRKIFIAAILSAIAAIALPTASAAARHSHRTGHSASHHRHNTRHRRHALRHRRRHTHRTSTVKPATTTESTTTVKSYTEGVLTLEFASGQTATGMVGEHTLILCPAKEPTKEEGSEPEESGDHGWSEGEHRGWGESGAHPDTAAWDGGSDEDSDDGPRLERCTPTSLMTGAKLDYAELSVGPTGAEWSLLILAA